MDVRSLLFQFVTLNQACFQAYCLPLRVEEHTRRMSQNYVWGTHVEIFSLSLYSGKPVFTAVNKGQEYYWAKYMGPSQPLVYPSHQIKLPADLDHFEICHVNNCHYEVCLTDDGGTIPNTPPYIGNASTLAVIIID